MHNPLLYYLPVGIYNLAQEPLKHPPGLATRPPVALSPPGLGPAPPPDPLSPPTPLIPFPVNSLLRNLATTGLAVFLVFFFPLTRFLNCGFHPSSGLSSLSTQLMFPWAYP